MKKQRYNNYIKLKFQRLKKFINYKFQSASYSFLFKKTDFSIKPNRPNQG